MVIKKDQLENSHDIIMSSYHKKTCTVIKDYFPVIMSTILTCCFIITGRNHCQKRNFPFSQKSALLFCTVYITASKLYQQHNFHFLRKNALILLGMKSLISHTFHVRC